MKTSGKSWSKYIDKSIKAKKQGWRKSKETGERYYEARPDHSDSNPKERYARGGSLTIYDIKERISEKLPNYFSKSTMKFFGQTMRDFKVKKMPNGKYLIYAPMKDRSSGRTMGYTIRYFNPETNDLDRLSDVEEKEVEMKLGIHKYKTSYAKGGMTEHGLEVGDYITDDIRTDNKKGVEVINIRNREEGNVWLSKGERNVKEFAKGGGVNSGKVYVLSDFSADSHEDSFEDGILNWVGSWDGKVGMTFSSKEDLIQYINENLIYTDYTEDMFDWETGEGKNIQTDVLCSDVKGYYPADEKEIELWKKGKKKLYNVHYFFYVMAVIPTEYAKGGAMAKGGKTKKGKKDPPIVRGYFDDEPYEYGGGGAIYKGDKVRIKDSNKSMIVKNIAKGKKGYVEFSGDAGTYLKGDLEKFANGGQLSISDRLPVSNQTDAERELELFINNDSGLYRRRKHPIEINLAKKIASGKFDINQAPKIFKYLIDDGIKEYTRLYGKITLTKQEKDNLAKEYVNQFLSDASEGSFDEYIPKKYKMEDGGMLGGFTYSIGGL